MGKSIKGILNNIPRLTFHVAAVAIVLASLTGAFFKSKIVMSVPKDYPAMQRGFPYALTLEDFRIDRYPSGAPLNYTSKLHAQGLDGTDKILVTSVNSDARIRGWRIYQMGYDTAADEDTSYSIVECVYDPFYIIIAFGLWLAIAGGAVLAVKTVPGSGGKKWLWALVTVFFIIFIYLTMDRVGLGRTDLRPALRSAWFIPHIVVYMCAYALMTAVTVYVIWCLARKGKHPIDNKRMSVCDRLARLGWAFLTMGMCMGALWAKQSWGDWWTWDPKENWALITWISYGLALHMRGRMKKGGILAILLISYLFLQMCWWGVNLLPATGSLHVY